MDVLDKFRNLFSKTKEEDQMSATATKTQSQAQERKTCSLPSGVEQLSAVSECCDESPLCQDAVRERAYLLWEKAGYPSSDGVEFWLQAEQELQAESDDE